MNNKERFEIAIDYFKDIKPLEEICIKYSVSKDDLKKHGLEDKFKIPSGKTETKVYHFTESNKILKRYRADTFNVNDGYFLDYSISRECDLAVATELRYIEKANVFALCVYFIDCPAFGTAKINFIGAYIITPDKHIKLYKVESQKEVWKKIKFDHYDPFCYTSARKPLNNSLASWNETFGKIFPLAYKDKTSYYCTITELHTLFYWMTEKEPRRKNTDKQKQIDKLLKLPLKEVTKEDLALRKGTEFGKRAFIEHVKDDMICIRFFQYNNFARKILETMRFYIDKKGTYFCQKNSLGQFVATSYEKEPDAIFNFHVKETVFDEFSCFENTVIDYYKDIITPDITRKTAQALPFFRLYPYAEKFLKQDYKDPVYEYLRGYNIPFNEFLEECYGEINSSASSPRKILGINEYQLASIKQFNWDYQGDIIKEAKEIIGAETLPSLTNEQTDNLLAILNDSRTFEIFKLLKEMYSLKTAFSMVNNLIALDKKERNNYRYNYFYFIDYKDYLTMIKEMEMTSIYRPQFKDADDIKRMHDEVLEIYNAKKIAIENEKFAKRIEILKKFEYTGNDFSVVAPTKAEDIANEGVKLHHCVKSYIGRVANGATNIVFIRKNTDLEKPFFTVEITNDNTVQQVHGLKNRNADTEPGLTEFIEKWAKDKNLTLCNINKIR